MADSGPVPARPGPAWPWRRSPRSLASPPAASKAAARSASTAVCSPSKSRMSGCSLRSGTKEPQAPARRLPAAGRAVRVGLLSEREVGGPDSGHTPAAAGDRGDDPLARLERQTANTRAAGHRRDKYSICTPVAPAAVFTIRADRNATQLTSQPYSTVRNFSNRNQRTRRPALYEIAHSQIVARLGSGAGSPAAGFPARAVRLAQLEGRSRSVRAELSPCRLRTADSGASGVRTCAQIARVLRVRCGGLCAGPAVVARRRRGGGHGRSLPRLGVGRGCRPGHADGIGRYFVQPLAPRDIGDLARILDSLIQANQNHDQPG